MGNKGRTGVGDVHLPSLPAAAHPKAAGEGGGQSLLLEQKWLGLSLVTGLLPESFVSS